MTSVPTALFHSRPVPAASEAPHCLVRAPLRLSSVLLALALAALALLPAGRVVAQELDLYEGEVVVSSQSDAERRAALPRALAQVFIKLTGDARAASEPLLAARLADAQRLMQQYRYRQDVVPEAGTPRVQLWLIARFDPAGVNALLAEAGRSVWPTPRPAPLLWLVIDDGRGPRLVSSAQAAAVSALTAQARNRGLRIAFPLVDLQDQRQIDAADVWSGRHATVADASARYHAPVQLVGRLQRGATWEGQWTLIEDGQVLARWSASDADPLVVLAAGADGAADALTARYAVPATAGAPGQYRIDIVGLRSAEDYLRASGHLQGLGVVRSMQVLSADGERLQVSVELGTGLEGLARVLQSARVLEMLEQPLADPSMADASTTDPLMTDPSIQPGTATAGTMPASVEGGGVDAVLRLLP